MKYFQILIIFLVAFSAFSNEKKESVKSTRKPSSAGEFICQTSGFERIGDVEISQIINNKCDTDKFVQLYRNEQTRWFTGYCCVSK